MGENIRIAEVHDIERVKAFLEQSEVTADGVESIIDNFIVMEDDFGNIQATLGIERLEQDGLLRSLVITPNVDQSGILTLFKSALSLAQYKEIRDLYLVTNKEVSVVFFTMLGFSKIEKIEIGEHILNSDHMKTVAHSENAIFMRSTLIKA